LNPVIDRVASWREEGKKAALATVVKVERSGPLGPGTSMAVSEDGQVVGSVSGGCVEPAVYEEARAVLGGEAARLVEYGIEDETAFEVGLPCGGTVRILVGPVDFEVVRELVEALAAERPVELELGVSGGARVVPAGMRSEPETSSTSRSYRGRGCTSSGRSRTRRRWPRPGGCSATT
jgi:xanthine dehydrogenase accessory factor